MNLLTSQLRFCVFSSISRLNNQIQMEINADIKRENFNIMCRTCLQTETDLVPIHDPKENEFGIAEMLEYCTVLKVSGLVV